MLCNLVVENYALISKLEIDFTKGLTIITGETGAGKSILLGALSLILGKRAEPSVLFNKDIKCIVEGTFDITHYGLHDFFTAHEIDYDPHTIIRREIAPSGKSRAFINDVPVTLELLTDLGIKLIDIHSQHHNLHLSDSMFQMKVLDSYAQAFGLLSAYQQIYREYKDIQRRFQTLSEEAARSKNDLEYLQFQYNQLHEAKLKEGEQEELEQELETLEHLEEIKTALLNAGTILQGEGPSAIQQIKDCHAYVGKIARFLQGHENLSDRLNSTYIELKDIAQEIESVNSQLVFDPDRLTLVNDRLSLLYTLIKKHQVSHSGALMELRDQFLLRINAITSYDTQLEKLSGELESAKEQLQKAGAQLSEKRKSACPSFEQKVVDMLQEVGIPNASFSIEMHNRDEFTVTGNEIIQFMFSANKNMKGQEISRVASGGEISRLMLCIKSLMSDATGLPTIIFDEIDTGVSGDIAERVGNIINRMADRMQIINITHLPQVASKGKSHFLVYKADDGNHTVTRMKLLTPDERLVEIAKMLSGEEITPAALENARVLLGR